MASIDDMITCADCGNTLFDCRCAGSVVIEKSITVPTGVFAGVATPWAQGVALLDAMRHLGDMAKGIVQVKQHQRKTKTGVVTVQQHQRNVLTRGEKKDLAHTLAQHIAEGKGARVDHASHAHAIAKHIAKTTNRAVHVTEHPKGGFTISHKAPPKSHKGPHITVRAEKTVVHHPEHGPVAVTHRQATAALKGKPTHDVGDRKQASRAPEPDTPEKAAAKRGLPDGTRLFGEHNGAMEVTMPADRILTDARAYQFKEGGDEYGVTGRLRDVKDWDSITGMTNVVMLHQTRDGKVYVVDGHQRTGLARRLLAEGKKVPDLRAIVFREEDGYSQEKMRRLGALMNIRQGTGTAIDIAKVLRDSELSDEERATIPAQSNEMYRDGEALAGLADDAFEELNAMPISNDEKKNAAIGAIVAREIKNPENQLRVIRALRKNKPQGRDEALDQVLAMKLAGFDKTKSDQMSMFAMDDTMSLIKPFSDIMGALRRDLQSDRSALGNAIRNQARLEAKGNVVDAERSAEGVEQADALKEFMKQSRYKGEADEFNATMQDLARKLNRGEIKKHEAVAAAQTALEESFGKIQQRKHQIGNGSDGSGNDGPDDVRGQAEETDEERERRRQREIDEINHRNMGGGFFGDAFAPTAAKSLALVDEIVTYLGAIPEQHRMTTVLRKALERATDAIPTPPPAILALARVGADAMQWDAKDNAISAMQDASSARGMTVLGTQVAECAHEVNRHLSQDATLRKSFADMNAFGAAVVIGCMAHSNMQPGDVSAFMQAGRDELRALAAKYRGA